MLLKRLVELYGRVQDRAVPPSYKRNKVPWMIEIGADGAFHGIVPTAGERGALHVETPYWKRQGTSPPPYLLVDNAPYVLGLGLDKWPDEKASLRHEAFVAMTRECAEATSDPDVEAVLRFLIDNVGDARAAVPQSMKAGDLIGFLVEGRRVFDKPAVRAFWTERLEERYVDEQGLECECMVCGRRGLVVQRHPVELKVGSDRATLIAANENAFESYGLKASEIAPCCYPCACAYGVALRYLLDSEVHRFSTAGGTYVFWTRRETQFNPLSMLRSPKPEEVRRLLEAPWRRSAPQVETNEFYALCVTSNQSRMVVRNWMHTTVPLVQEHLAAYFGAQRMVGPDGGDAPYPVSTLAMSLVRRPDDLSPRVMPSLLEYALLGAPLPTWLLHQAAARARADTDNRMTRPRAALMRLVFESQRLFNPSEEVPIVNAELDAGNTHPAYLCGRMLAVLEEVQRAAIPGAKATLVDKYYGTACSAPATVFGTLMRNAQSHLSKLRKTREAAFHALQNRLGDIASLMPEAGFPRTLSLQDQALFGLGYYQQKAADRAARQAAGEAKSETDSDN